MGKVVSTIKRAVRNFDVERRAIKYIERSATRPEAAPKHPNTHRPIWSQDAVSKLFQRNPDLDNRVDKLNIRSCPIKKGILPDGTDYVKQSTRRLPQRIEGSDPFPEPHIDYGFVVPESIPTGRITMRQAVNMIKAHQLQENTIDELAQSTTLEKDKVEAIVNHFMLFTIPSKGYWMPPSLLPGLTESSQLLDKPVEDGPVDEPFGGAARSGRREALRGLEFD
ncbi:unnamed protein product [Dicrocoelium dendriticum]|nr:unnamed protein product [Dicrocoelium dendriticum]